MECGLLGRKLGHSYSPQIHAHLADYDYFLYEKEPDELADFFKNGTFHAINVTIPYKKDVIPFLDELTPTAKRMGAVNTIVRREDGTFIGHNTDYFGFSSMVEKSGVHVNGHKVLVLGSGGASNTAVVVLKEMGANVIIISRSGEDNYDNLDKHADATVIVNATPVGMYPNNGKSPVNLDLFPNLEGVLDVIYNPSRTQLLLDAEARGLITMNGLWMLVAQAKESAEWFAGHPFSDDMIALIHNKLRMQMENIILVGMPGCGKSTIGKAIAEKTGKTFIDADAYLEETTGRKITDIIPNDGVEAFRDMETAVLAELGKRSGLVLATGGGCVTKDRNYPLLHQNGGIFWLTRDLNKLPTDGRPLSQAGQLEEMFRVREPMYRSFADAMINNNQDLHETVETILNSLEADL